jgi:hypothetical protein
VASVMSVMPMMSTTQEWFERMQEQIRGWREAAKRNRDHPTSREVPLTTSARIMGGGLLLVCRALARMAAGGDRSAHRSTPSAGPRRTAVMRGGAARRARVVRGARMRSRARMRSGGRMRPADALRRAGALCRGGTSRTTRRMSARMTGSMTGADLKRVAGSVGALVATMGVVRWLAARSTGTAGDRPNRWMMVTINCPPQRLASRADLPAPISRLGDAVDIKIGPAPGDRGSELGVRLRELPRPTLTGGASRRPGDDPRRAIREALRDAKSLMETGEILRRERPMPERPVPAGRLPEFAERRGGRS